MAVQYLDNAGTDGACLGQSGKKVAFFGATPVVQPSSASQAAYTVTAVTAVGTTTISQVATSGKWAFASSTAAAAMVTRVTQLQVDIEGVGVLLNKMRADLVTLGILKGSA